MHVEGSKAQTEPPRDAVNEIGSQRGTAQGVGRQPPEKLEMKEGVPLACPPVHGTQALWHSGVGVMP